MRIAEVRHWNAFCRMSILKCHVFVHVGPCQLVWHKRAISRSSYDRGLSHRLPWFEDSQVFASYYFSLDWLRKMACKVSWLRPVKEVDRTAKRLNDDAVSLSNAKLVWHLNLLIHHRRLHLWSCFTKRVIQMQDWVVSLLLCTVTISRFRFELFSSETVLSKFPGFWILWFHHMTPTVLIISN